MKPATLLSTLAAGVAIAALIPAWSGAQQLPIDVPAMGKLRHVQEAESLLQMVKQRQQPHTNRSELTFQMLEFTFGTGGDDLRNDSVVAARLVFPDSSRQQVCSLHGAGATGAAANISWDNNSTHIASPCRLARAMTLAALKQMRIVIGLYGPGRVPGVPEAVLGGPLALTGVRSQDNWNINRIEVRAYNPGANGQACVFSFSADPVARLTGDQPDVTVTDLPNQCP
ncbi:MAG: hypothetical protein OJF55_000155 [Rhodanobacteraceae bacterium]|jgi:hypothetical protein|nr:MAG: hypothetical protein OJF55_000155 [Rhodanobacteraceae bacterium]